MDAEFADGRLAGQQKVEETESRLIGKRLGEDGHGLKVTHLEKRIGCRTRAVNPLPAPVCGTAVSALHGGTAEPTA
jgi:hypothetical protein